MKAGQNWLDIVPWLALIVAIGSASISGLTYRLTRRQAIERQPRLIISLDNLWFTKREYRARDYELAVMITNRSATANTVVAAELIMALALPSGHEVKLRLPAGHASKIAQLPIRLDSYASKAVKFDFCVQANLIPANSSIKSHVFEFTDTAGEAYTVEPKLISERRNNAAEDSKD